MTSSLPITWPSSSLLRSAFGCALMSPRPSQGSDCGACCFLTFAALVEGALVQDVNDGGMGSLRFWQEEGESSVPDKDADGAHWWSALFEFNLSIDDNV